MGRVPNNAGAGNIRYMAPERFDPGSSDMRRTMASDVYAFACVCLLVSLLTIRSDPILTERRQLYTRKRPFHQELDVLVAMQVVLGNRPARPTEEHGHVAMTDVMWQLIMDAWHQDSAARPSMLQLEERLRSMHDAYNSSQRLSSMADRRRERVQLSTAQAGSVFNNDPPTVLRTSVILPISSSDAPGHPLTHWELVEPCVPQGETYKSPRKRNLLERVKWLLTRKNTRLE
jgi:serine/threonine protein kinase